MAHFIKKTLKGGLIGGAIGAAGGAAIGLLFGPAAVVMVPLLAWEGLTGGATIGAITGAVSSVFSKDEPKSEPVVATPNGPVGRSGKAPTQEQVQAFYQGMESGRYHQDLAQRGAQQQSR